jgi:hypothetical protein
VAGEKREKAMERDVGESTLEQCWEIVFHYLA